MRDGLRVLVVGADPGLADVTRRCVSQTQPPGAVQWLSDASVALARVGGGDIDVVVIDQSLVTAAGDNSRDLLELLHEAGPRTKTVIAARSSDWISDLRRMAESFIRAGEACVRSMPRRGPKPRVIGFIGAKGGVGTTTVALNTACVLAEKHSVVLAELGSGNDTLTLRLRTAAKSERQPGAVLDGLWSVKGIPGLRVALAQDIFAPDKVAGELETMGAGSDYLVLDLGSTRTPVVRSALPRLDALVVVMDLEMLSVECAKRMVAAIGCPDLCPREAIGLVIVNRSALACPSTVNEVQRLVGIPVQGAVPSASDVFGAAQKARRPVVSFDPDSLAGQCLAQVAYSVAELA